MKQSNMEKQTLSQYDPDLSDMLKQLQFNKELSIKGYSEINIPFKYTPNKPGPFKISLTIYFGIYLHSPPITFEVM